MTNDEASQVLLLFLKIIRLERLLAVYRAQFGVAALELEATEMQKNIRTVYRGECEKVAES